MWAWTHTRGGGGSHPPTTGNSGYDAWNGALTPGGGGSRGGGYCIGYAQRRMVCVRCVPHGARRIHIA